LKQGRTDEIIERPDAYYEYELVGVLIHSGSADSGHYYSVIKERTGSKRWLQFNDRIVTEFEQDSIGPETFGGMHPVRQWDSFQRKHVIKELPLERNAYMLFYERVNHDPSFDQIDATKSNADNASAASSLSSQNAASTATEGLVTFGLPGGGNVPPAYDTLLMSIFQADHNKYKAAQDQLIAAAAQTASSSNANQKTDASKSTENLLFCQLVIELLWFFR